MYFKSGFWLWKTLEVPDWNLASWSCFGYGHWSLIHPWSKILISIMILKVQTTSMYLMSWFWALEDARSSWLEFGILILIWIWSLGFDTPKFWSLAPYINFEGAKNIHVLKVLLWGFGECWWFLTGIWHLDLDLDMFIGLWYNHDLNFGSLSWFWRCKEHPCP